MDQTKRGEQDREREREATEGEPARTEGAASATPANTTRDKGVKPAPDNDQRGEKKS